VTALRRTTIAAVAALCVAPAGAGAAGKGGVAVSIDGATPPAYLASSQLPDETGQQTVHVRNTPGGPVTEDKAGGTTAAGLLRLLGLDPAKVRQMVVAHGSNAPDRVTKLSQDEIVDGFTTPQDGPRQATFDGAYGQGVVRFFRPMRDADDVNGPDGVDPPNGETLAVSVTTDGSPRLTVAATATPTAPAANQAVAFTASVPTTPGVTYSFFWDFGDGGTARTADASHAYTAGSTVTPSVTVVGSDGSSGVATTEAIVVAGAPGGTATTPAPKPSPAPGDGGAGSGGGTAATGGSTGAPNAPSTGPGEGRSDGAPTPTTPSPKRSPGTRRTRRARSTPARTTTTPATPQASTQPQPAAASPGPAGSPRAPGRRDVPDRRAPRSTRSSSRGLPRIDGVLVSARGDEVSAAIAAADALVDRPQDERDAARAAAGGDAGVLGWVGGGVLLVGLLGLGAWRERLRASGRPLCA
jgi:hypothetical protein